MLGDIENRAETSIVEHFAKVFILFDNICKVKVINIYLISSFDYSGSPRRICSGRGLFHASESYNLVCLLI